MCTKYLFQYTENTTSNVHGAGSPWYHYTFENRCHTTRMLTLNKLDASSNGINPQALSNTLGTLRTLQPGPSGLLNHIDPWTQCLSESIETISSASPRQMGGSSLICTASRNHIKGTEGRGSTPTPLWGNTD